jgi:hypothetical protein
MKTLIFCFLLSIPVLSQTLTGTQLLDKAIAYHDPNDHWTTFHNVLNVTMKTPNEADRVSKISINLPQHFFKVQATKDGTTTEFTIDKGNCSLAINGKTQLTDEELKKHNLNCERANLYKNYYTYLYGLPMKLKDNGTVIHDKVEEKSFKGKTYLVLKVTYDKTVGSDVWYFYFNPKTYAMEIYQFFKTDTNGQLKTDSGEYILLSDIELINDIKMPKARAWYYNKDDSYLGTDTLIR